MFVCILKRNVLMLLEKNEKPQKPFTSLPISSPIIVGVFSAYVVIFLGISSGTGSAKILLKGLPPVLKRLQKVFKSTLEPGGIGLTISPDTVLKHLRILSYLSFCI